MQRRFSCLSGMDAIIHSGWSRGTKFCGSPASRIRFLTLRTTLVARSLKRVREFSALRMLPVTLSTTLVAPFVKADAITWSFTETVCVRLSVRLAPKFFPERVIIAKQVVKNLTPTCFYTQHQKPRHTGRAGQGAYGSGLGKGGGRVVRECGQGGVRCGCS